jgi:hypothetical protein
MVKKYKTHKNFIQKLSFMIRGSSMKRLAVICFVLLITCTAFGLDTTIVQYNWLGTNGSNVMFSRIGEVTFRLTSDDVDMFTDNNGVFINVGFSNNVLPDPQWIVRNLFIVPGQFLISGETGCMFGFGDSTMNRIPWDIGFVNVTITVEPVDYGASMPDQEFIDIEILHQDYLTGGIGGNSGDSDLVHTLGPWQGLPVFPDDGDTTSNPNVTAEPIPVPTINTTAMPTSTALFTPTPTPTGLPTLSPTPTPTPFITPWPTPTRPPYWAPKKTGGVKAPLIPPIDEGKNECAPSSVARSLQYMAALNGEEVDDPQEMKDDLVDDMDTDPESGTTVDNMLDGKNEYTEENDLPVSSEVTYDLNLEEIIDVLNDGGDVEILIAWNGGGGHAAMVVDVVLHEDGSATITYVDDPCQGDGQAENETHTIHVDPDGNFEGGRVFGFLVERWEE